MKFLSTYQLFEGNSFSNHGKVILKLFREHLLNQNNLDLIQDVTGIILTQDIVVDKEGSHYKPIMRYVNAGSGEYTMCSILMNRTYETWNDFLAKCQYLNDLFDKNNDYYGRERGYGRHVSNNLELTLKCSRDRKIHVKFNISLDKEKLIDLNERFICPFNVSSGEFLKYLVEFLEQINERINNNRSYMLEKSRKIQEKFLEDLIKEVHKNPNKVEEIKKYTFVWDRFNQITNNGGTHTSSMLDRGFYD